MFSFDVLKNRYVIEGRLHAEGALHIGTGVSGTTTDAPFIRMGNAAFIPGSSLRGVLRSSVERLMHAVKPGENYCVTFCSVAPGCDSDPRIEAERLEARAAEGKLQFCPMCQFFGSTAIASRFKIADAIQTAGKPKSSVRRDGVGIDRDTETARDQIKYDFEVLEPECDFRVTLQVENIEDSDKAILYMLLVELKNGIDVGGKRSRGLGRVVLNPEYNVQYFDEDGDHDLSAYLTSGDLKAMTCQDFEEDLKAAFNRFTRRKGGGAQHVAVRVA